nr:unnamed protein product [Digitaria exilis]
MAHRRRRSRPPPPSAALHPHSTAAMAGRSRPHPPPPPYILTRRRPWRCSRLTSATPLGIEMRLTLIGIQIGCMEACP